MATVRLEALFSLNLAVYPEAVGLILAAVRIVRSLKRSKVRNPVLVAPRFSVPMDPEAFES